MSELNHQAAKKRLAEIKKLGNNSQAINQIQELLAEFPNFIAAWIELGLIYRRQGDRHSALNTFTSALKFAPDNQEIKLKLSAEQLHFNQFDNCRQIVNELLRINPQNVAALIRLGEIYHQQQKRTEALQLFEQALAIDPQAIWASIHLATELKHFGRFDEAAQQLQQALEYHPHNFKLLMKLGALERQRHQQEAASKWFSLAIKKATNSQENIQAQLSAIEALIAVNNINEALQNLQSILNNSPNNIRAKLIYGSLLKQQLDFKSAVKIYRDIITLDPKHLQAHLELANCLSEMGNNQAALDIMQTAQSFYPHELQVYKKIGDLYRNQKNRSQALVYYQKSLEIAPQNLTAQLDVAIGLKELNDLEEATRQINLILETYPNNFYALMQMGQLEHKRQQLDSAWQYFQRAKENYPEKIEPYLSEINVLYDLGRLETAQSHLEILQQKYPNNYKILIYSGKMTRKLGQRETALHWFRLAQNQASNLAQALEAELLAIEEIRDLGRLNEALELIEAIINKFPAYTRAQTIKGNILQKIPNLLAAAEVYKNILAAEPEHLHSHIELARIYSYLGQVETAITFLETTHHLLGTNIQVLIQLGFLNQALENWQAAGQWYQTICDEYPEQHHGYCLLAELFFLQGETETALDLLHKAQVKIPNSVHILIKLIEIQTRLGNLDLNHQLLKDGLIRFPNNIKLLWQLCSLHMAQGNYHTALNVLDRISTDNQDWLRKTAELRGNIYFYQYDYQQAEIHLRTAISLAPVANNSARTRLANILMLTGRIEAAHQEFKIATQELNLKTPPGKASVPLRGHAAMLINELRINPPLLQKLQITQQKTKSEKILELGSLLAQEPTYLGTALYLAKELRHQGIFAALQESLAKNSAHLPAIPKTIIQFWDEPEPPIEVQRICQSWIEHNPEYKYIRFSLPQAIAFLEEHYNAQVLQAFANCDEPATQADFFRLAYLNKMGGFYADADDLCRQSLDAIVNLNPELVILQEEVACFGNNFLGCIPGQSMIRTAFYQAVNNLAAYCNESPWFKTGPGLLTSVVCSGLVPYLAYQDYQMWPRLLVLTQTELRKIIYEHISLAYKRTDKGWQHKAYQRRIKNG